MSMPRAAINIARDSASVSTGVPPLPGPHADELPTACAVGSSVRSMLLT
jgi:hypothetical protein